MDNKSISNWSNIPLVIGLLCLSAFAVKSLRLFSVENGLLDVFLHAIDTKMLPDGTPLTPITTNGWSPTIDWLLRAPAVFCWPFANNESRPDTTLIGFLFAGAWGAAWALIVIESLRSCNKWRLISFDSIIGIFVFNHSHAVMTPLYLALHLLTSPSAVAPTREGILVDAVDLITLPASFVVGYIVPIILIALPAPLVVSITFKQTVMAWYQQWNLFISVPHFIFTYILRRLYPTFRFPIYRDSVYYIYGFAFAITAIPYWTVAVLSCTASLWPGLFADGISDLLQPSKMFLPKSPWSGAKDTSLSDGFRWVIQWDYLIGTAAMLAWAATMYTKSRRVYTRDGYPILDILIIIIMYTLLGGPAGAAVGLLWERDKLLLSKP